MKLIFNPIDECINADANKEELIEALKMGMMNGGSTAYPYVRFALKVLIDKKII
ncbi:MAG: hypothetical protein PVH88_16910 [Ignavibacteria bacterium]